MNEGMGHLEKDRSGKNRHRTTRVTESGSFSTAGVPQNDVDNRVLTAKRLITKHRNFVRNISKQVPEGFDFDSNRIPPNTLAALENAGLKINPFERDGKHYVEVHDGEKTEVITHTQAVQWLQNIEEEYREDARKLREKEEEIAELERLLKEEGERTQIGQKGDIETKLAERNSPYVDAANDKVFETERKAPVKDLIESGISNDELVKYLREHPEIISKTPPELSNDIVVSNAPKPFSDSNRIDKVPNRLNQETLDPKSDIARVIAQKGEYLQSLNQDVEDAKIIERPKQSVRPIVLKALSNLFKEKVEVSSDGEHIILQREGEGPLGNPFTIAAKDASRMVALEAERIRLKTSPAVEESASARASESASQHENVQKPKLTHEEMRAYLARVRNKPKAETESESNSNERGTSPQLNFEDPVQYLGQKKPHLNNPESIAYLKDVQEKRARQRASEAPLSVLKEPSLDDPEIKKVLEKAQIRTRRQLRQLGQERINEERFAQQNNESSVDIDIKLPLEEQGVDILLPSIPHERVSHRTLESIKDDIAFLVQARNAKFFPAVAFSERYPDFKNLYERTRGLGRKMLIATWIDNELTSLKQELAESQKETSEEKGNDQKPEISLVAADVAFLERAKSEISYGSKEFGEFVAQRDPEFAKEWKRLGGSRDAATIMWIERTLQELKSEQQKPRDRASRNEQPPFFDNRFETKFGITRAELSKFEGFNQLSEGQQMLVYENLKEYAEQGTDGYLAKVWEGIEDTSKNDEEKSITEGSGGTDAYGEVLKKLISNAHTFGQKVHVEKRDGTPFLFPDLINFPLDRGINRGVQYQVTRDLNRAAYEFMKIPASWEENKNSVSVHESKLTAFLKDTVLKVESRKKYREYITKQKAFEESKKIFARVLEATGTPQGEIVKKLIDIDAQVHAIRLMETDHEAVAALHSMNDEDLWKKIGTTLASGPLAGGFGTVGRAATAHALRGVSNPLVLKSLSDLNTWSPEAAEQRERDRRNQTDRMYQHLVPRVVTARQEVQTPEGIKDMGVTAKLERLAGQLDALPPVDECTKEQIIERARILAQLKERVTFAYDKLKLGRIQFGNNDEASANIADFLETIALAQIILVREESGSRIPQLRSNSRLRQYARKLTIVASLVGATSLASMFAIEEFKTGEVSGKLKNWFTSMKADFNDFKFDTTTITPSKPSGVPEATQSTSAEIVLEKDEGGRPYRQSIFHPEQEQPNTPTANAGLGKSLEEGDQVVRGESSGEQKQEPVLSESPRPSVQTPREAFNTASEQDRIANMSVQERSAFEATYNTTPQSPTAAEKAKMKELFSVSSGPKQLSLEARAELKELFTEKISILPRPTKDDIVSGGILKMTFLEANALSNWPQVGNIPIESFIINSMEQGTEVQRVPALAQLAKIFREVGKPPYNVTMHRSDSVEIFSRQAFTAIELARKEKLETDSMRELLGSIKGIGQK